MNPIENVYANPATHFSVERPLVRPLSHIDPGSITAVEQSGYNPALGAARETIAAMGSQYPFVTAPVEMFVRGTSANDQPGGSGAETIRIHAIDLVGGKWVRTTTDYNLPGLGRVSIGNHIAIILAETLSSNDLVENEIIYIEDDPGTTVYARINQGIGCSSHCMYVVPDDYEFAITGLEVGLGDPLKRVEIYLRICQPGKTTWQTIRHVTGVGPVVSLPEPMYKPWPARTLIDLQALVDAGTAAVSGTIYGLLFQTPIKT